MSTIADLEKELEEANIHYAQTRAEKESWDGQLTLAMNRLNKAQEIIDEYIELLRRKALRASDWGQR